MTSSDLPILGYRLQQDDGLGGDFSVVYDGSQNPQQLSYSAYNLVSGRTYKYKVNAVDVNGQGSDSAVYSFISCVAPTGLELPTITATTETTFTASWCPPANEGGCGLTGYKLWMDNGAGSAIDIPVDEVTIANNPNLFEHTATLAGNYTGSTIRAKIEAINS